MKYSYPAIIYSQLPKSGPQEFPIACLVAPCDEILKWAGIPRKSEEVADDSVTDGERIQLHGYQREAETKRLSQLVTFFQNPQNVIPTSILLARRFPDKVSFRGGESISFGAVSAQVGTIEIESDISEEAPFGELLEKLVGCLIERSPQLKLITVNEKLVTKWKARLAEQSDAVQATPVDDESTDTEETDNATAANPYSPDTHIEDFYKEILLRSRLCSELPFLNSEAQLLGLSRQMIMDYLAPVTVVDGQHRLLGAKEALDEEIRQYLLSPEFEATLESNPDLDTVQVEEDQRKVRRRVFSATMLMNSDWAEHVFQFVVVNQKVKPISKALLSSIISTSLSSGEIDNIQRRLERAGIQIDDYKVMGRLTEDSNSPFKGFVKKGFTADKAEDKHKLEWAVLNGLAVDFRELRNLKPYHKRNAGQLDPAQEWKDSCLTQSGMLEEHESVSGQEGYEAWRNPTVGLWLDCFFEFWKRAKDKLSDETNDLARWGERPKVSNIFNGATMAALQSDFFDYLHNKETKPAERSEFFAAMDDYFGRMKPEFFGRPWNLPGNRVDRSNRETLATYLESHRKSGKIDGKWKIFKSL